MLVVGVGDCAAFAFLQAIERGQEGVQVHEALHGAYIGALARFRHGHQHAFVKGRYDGLALFVGFVTLLTPVSIVVGNGSARLGSQANGMHLDARGQGVRCPGECIVFVVLAVGDDQDDTAGFALWVKGVRTQRDGPADGRALQRNGIRCGGVEEQLDGSEVQRQWGLDIGVSRKHHQSDAVAVEALDQAFDGPLRQIESGHADVFGEHGLGHVERHHDVHAIGFDLFHARAPFRIHHAHGQQSKGGSPNEEFPDVSAGPCIRPEGGAQLQVDRFGHAFLFPAVMGGKQHKADRRDQQGRPSPAGVHVELGGHLLEQEGDADNGQPESAFKQRQPSDVGEDLVTPTCHGSVRMNR